MAEAAETQPLLPGRIRRHGMKGFGYDRDALFCYRRCMAGTVRCEPTHLFLKAET
jgi:hypothetical protein